MSKFSRLAQANPGAAPPPAPATQPSQPPWSPDSISPYPQGPPVPPRPSASPQPGQQRPQQPPQSMYGSPHLGAPQPQWQQQQQQSYNSPQQQYGQPQGYSSHPGYPPSPQPPNAYGAPSPQQPPYSPYGAQYQQPGRPPQQQPGYPGQSPYQQPSYPGQAPPQQGYGPPGQQPPYPGGPQGGPPGGPQGGYGGPPGGPGGPQGGPPGGPQGGYGGPGGPGPGGPPPAGNPSAYKRLLDDCIREKGLQAFYPPGSPALDQIANRASQQVATLAQQWRINSEIASDIVKLALYDVILYIDDSGSMAFEENGERIDDLKLILSRVAFATALFDDDGIQVRFMNSPDQGNGIKNEQMVNEMVGRTKFSGLTPMGRELQNKILGPLVVGPARSGALQKPILVITITDGQPTGESPSDVARIIKGASEEMQRSRYGKGALAFQFAQVGNDLKAREFLGKLDEEPTIGDIIDCTSNYEVEADEMKRANPPVDLTPELWLIKLLLGSIDSSYDAKDEQSSAPRPPQGGPGGYGGPQGGYGGPGGPPGGQYGGPPPGQYGGPPPGQGGYGGPHGGGPPGGGYGQQGGYPPQQGGYPPQQGGYGGPPPPRY